MMEIFPVVAVLSICGAAMVYYAWWLWRNR